MVQEKEEEDRIRQYNESLQGRDREVKKKKVRRAPLMMINRTFQEMSSPSSFC